jgi:hypothetical protein
MEDGDSVRQPVGRGENIELSSFTGKRNSDDGVPW